MQIERPRWLLKLHSCPGGCYSGGQWEGDSLWSREWLCLDKAKGSSWQDSWGLGHRAARPGPQHPLCSLWFSCFFENCVYLGRVSHSDRAVGCVGAELAGRCPLMVLPVGVGGWRRRTFWLIVTTSAVTIRTQGPHWGQKRTAEFSCCCYYCFI